MLPFWPYTDTMREERMVMSLRMPPEVHEAMTEAAEEEDRSLNAQIVYVLRRWIAEHQRSKESTDE